MNKFRFAARCFNTLAAGVCMLAGDPWAALVCITFALAI